MTGRDETLCERRAFAKATPNTPEISSMSDQPIGRAQARYLTNDEAATFLRLSPRTLEKLRVIGGGPRFRKFGRRVLYAVEDLEAWANARSFEMTSDPEYMAQR
jgi:hypothetical protein